MPKPLLAHVLSFSFLVGCANNKVAPAPVPSSAALARTVAPEPVAPGPSAAPAASNYAQPLVTAPANAGRSPQAANVLDAKSSKPTAPASPGSAAKAPKPSLTASAKVAAAAPLPQPPKATLDFKTLVERLRNTSSIGVFTKLSIKNEVDDLLGDFRSYHAGKVPPTLDDLHDSYDGLVLKVVTLVQKGDASLASAISASRGAIWERLANRESFQTI